MLQQGFQNAAGRPGFSRDMSDADLSTHMKHVGSTGGLLVNFAYVKVRIKSRGADTNGQVQTRLTVTKQPKGDRSTVAPRFITEDQAAQQFPREWDLFKKYDDVPTTGTPLSELPGISMSQIGLLVLNGLRSIEDLIEVSEDLIGQLGLDAVKAQKTAKSWWARKQDAAEDINAADVEARFQIQIDTMAKSAEAMEERNRQLEAQVAALQSIQASSAGATVQTVQTQTPAPAVEVNAGENLEYDISKMPDPMSEGPDVADGLDDDLTGFDDDPLGLAE